MKYLGLVLLAASMFVISHALVTNSNTSYDTSTTSATDTKITTQNATGSPQTTATSFAQPDCSLGDILNCRDLRQENTSIFTLGFAEQNSSQVTALLCDIQLSLKDLEPTLHDQQLGTYVLILATAAASNSTFNCSGINEKLAENGTPNEWNMTCVAEASCQTLFQEYFYVWIIVIAVVSALLAISTIALTVYCWRKKHTGYFKRYSDIKPKKEKKNKNCVEGHVNPCVTLAEENILKKSKSSHGKSAPPPIPEEVEPSTEYSTENAYETAITPLDDVRENLANGCQEYTEVEDTKM